jgi:uncharacterized membrane protein
VTLAATRNARSAAPRWMIIALFGSLALNLIVIGAATGFVWRHHAVLQAATTSPHLSPSLLSYASTLSPERHKELSALTEEQRQNVRPLRRQLREAREEAVHALVAEPFAKDRFEAAQSRLLIADQKAREAVHELYAAIAVNMTPEERRGFADWRQKRRQMRNLLDEPEKQAHGQR